MAIGAMIHTFTIELADVDRGVYDELQLRVAQHPSETPVFMVARLLAYCLEYEDGIEFSAGVSTTDEPAVLVRDLTGRITAWIEIGAPDAARVHFGSKLADRTTIYTHRRADKVLAAWTGKTIHRADEIVLHSFDDGVIDDLARVLERRNTMTLSRTEGQLYIELNGAHFTTAVHDQQIQ